MKVLILGIDGYIGHTLAVHLLKKEYKVAGVDNYSRRVLVKQVGGDSLTPISTTHQRDAYLRSFPNFIDQVSSINLKDHFILSRVLREYKPDTIVHLAEQPSAPYSMINAAASIHTQFENTIGNLSLLWAMKEQCPDAHLVKIGSMGEYGTPNCPIPEGIIPGECMANPMLPHDKTIDIDCPMEGLLFPRQPGSFYHLSKVHDTYNIDFACRTWGIRATDIQQGVVYGANLPTSTDDINELTRFDYDECFGTVINRFCVQALLDEPLTIYGKGLHIRSILPIKDSIQCLNLVIDNPVKAGRYRSLNQFGSYYNIRQMANMVVKAAVSMDLNPRVDYVESPRTESLRHEYNVTNENLLRLGYKPSNDDELEITRLMYTIKPYISRAIVSTIPPKTKWR